METNQVITNSKRQLKILQNLSKDRFWGKRKTIYHSKVIQRLYNIDLYTYLGMNPYRWGKRLIQYIYYKITSVTHRDRVGTLWYQEENLARRQWRSLHLVVFEVWWDVG